MTFTRIHISVFLAFAVAAWWCVLAIQGYQLSIKHLAPFGTVVGVLGALALALEYYLWAMPWLQGWFVKRPDLRGTWRVKLESDWIAPDTQQKILPITCYMGVEQTLSSLQMHLMTPDSESWFVAHSIRLSPSESGYQVIGVYTNKPALHHRGKRSEMHFGAIVIDTHGQIKSKPDTLTAEYWTDRKTSGQMIFLEKVTQVYSRYSDAQSAF